MNSFEFSFIVFILVSHALSFGRNDDISFSLCWLSKDDSLERLNGNIWLNGTSLKLISKVGKVTSLTVSPAVDNKLTLKYGGSVQAWTLRIDPRANFTKIRGLQKPLKQPTSVTKSFLDMMSPNEVFSCENGTLFFHQDENFFLALGHTMHAPVKLESRTPSMLKVSWVENCPAVSNNCTVTLYHTESSSYKPLSMDTTTNNHYHFTALDSCSLYVACVETAATHSFTCLSTITEPDIPKDFEVTSWNSSSISLAWDCPANCKFSSFLLTAFYLNGADQITEEVLLWHKDTFVFILSDLEPCTRVRFGLQTVCQAGIESRYSTMVLNDGNSVHSSIESLRQTSSGHDSYTLSWESRDTSSISMFRVYHEGELQDTTLVTNFTVGGLLPCQQHQAKVEALCGDGVLMNAKTVVAHTAPLGVSELRYRSKDSTAQWKPCTTHQPAVSFVYELSLENGTTIQSSRVIDTELPLPGLEEGKTYILHVWEECDKQWKTKHSHVGFEGANSSLKFFVSATGSSLDQELQLDRSSMGLTIVVPWSLPEDLLEGMSEPRAQMEKIFQDKLQEMLNDFHQRARVELVAIEPAGEPHKTYILFMSFDASKTEEDIPLPVEDQLDYIHSLNTDHITVTDGLIYWEGPDLCASSKQTLCPLNSLCINTLGSYACLCQHGYYDVSSVVDPPVASHPICNEKGLFSHCLGKLMTGSIAKPYLTSHIGGQLAVRLNNGWCPVDETEMFYYFRISRKASECGTERRVNKTHIQLQNTLTVTIRDQIITRRDLKVIWKCVYPRRYVRNAQVSVDVEWHSSASLVAFNSSLQLGLTMTLHADESYTDSYRDAITMGPEDTLFFQVALQTNNSFASDVLLQVESCWTTESPDYQDTVQGVLLQDGCAVDNTFQWLSVNGLAQNSRFSIQMFTMPKGLSIYIHCLVNICGHDEDCTKNCSSQQRTKRSGSQMDGEGAQAAVVSAGPLVVNRMGTSAVPPSYWPEHMTMIPIVAGLIGFLGVTVLSVSVTKAIMTYYERLPLQ
ncbi:uncharacterized protein LOC114550440 isoform X1 [Perca flavescens]|uniref:uncharacterized protein LOC114550440 isoform X1 n=1 Tax=Perca flavescens TaxID=8167 RepID=UPI00106EA729|nr:uncharacterized protein LOC114550440 isoform X1 [Perca flavescens]